jgi:peptide/nickel transport system substrate-binding protein
MGRIPARILVALVALALSLFVVACGGGDDEETSSSGGSSGNGAEGGAPPKGKKGGTIKMLASTDVDYMDPGQTYYTIGQMIALATQRHLYAIPPGKTEPVPDLAAAPPEISDDNKMITVKLRTGVKFAPPVNREVTSADIKYAFERAFTTNVNNQYATTYFNSLDGAPAERGKYKPISGVETPDDQTVVFKLSEPAAVPFAAALTMEIGIPIPKEYAEKYDRKSPTDYDNYVVATGPYMVANDSKGKIDGVGWKKTRSIELVRNPNWNGKATGDFRPAYVDKWSITTNNTDATVASRQVLAGSGLVFDSNPPAAVLAQAVRRNKDQVLTHATGGYRYFPMNTTIKPFDDVNVRKAVTAAFDRDAARKARGGKYIGEIPTHFLPPDFPGFEEAGGMQGPGVDYLKNPRGDMALAAEYMKKAGFASGKYDGNQTFLMIASNVDPGKAQAEVAQAQLEKLGFNMKLRLVPQDAVYTEWCQVPEKNVAMCGGAGWQKDFFDPQSMLQPVFSGDSINPRGGNNNMAELDDPKINEAMDKAALATGDARNKAWGDVDKMITEQAPAVPFVWDNQTLVFSKNVVGVANPSSTLFDLSFTSLK